MDRFEFLENWEFYTDKKLTYDERIAFLQECKRLLHLEDRYLKTALKIAKTHNKMDLEHIEKVALQIKQRERSDYVEPLQKSAGMSFNLSSLPSIDTGDYFDRRERRRRY